MNGPLPSHPPAIRPLAQSQRPFAATAATATSPACLTSLFQGWQDHPFVNPRNAASPCKHGVVNVSTPQMSRAHELRIGPAAGTRLTCESNVTLFQFVPEFPMIFHFSITASQFFPLFPAISHNFPLRTVISRYGHVPAVLPAGYGFRS